MRSFDLFNLARMAVLVCCAFGVATDTRAEIATVPLSKIAPDAPVTGQVRLLSIAPEGPRVRLRLAADLPNLIPELDTLGRSFGNMGSSTKRVTWIGPSRLTAINGNTLHIRSKARLTIYLKVLGKYQKIGRDTKRVDIRLTPDWDANAKAGVLNWEIANIRNLPGTLEKLLKRMGVDFGGRLVLPISRAGELAALNPQLENLALQGLNGANGASILVDLIVDQQGASRLIAEHLGKSVPDSGLAGALFDFVFGR